MESMIQALLVLFLIAIAIEWVFVRTPYSWESCIRQCKALRAEGYNPTMHKTWYGWKVIKL